MEKEWERGERLLGEAKAIDNTFSKNKGGDHLKWLVPPYDNETKEMQRLRQVCNDRPET
jgi:hypothetical protein